MSHAFIAAPMLVPVAGPSALAIAASTILLPVLIGATMAAVVAIVAKASEKERKCCGDYLNHDLNHGMKLLEEKYEKSELPASVKISLTDEMAALRALPGVIMEKVRNGNVSPSDLNHLKESISRFDQKIAQTLVRFEEQKKSEIFFSQKVANLFGQIEGQEGSFSDGIEGLRKKWREIEDFSGDRREEKIDGLKTLAARLSAMLDKDIMKKLIASLAGAGQTEEMTRGKPPGPTPPDCNPEFLSELDRHARLKRFQVEIDEYFTRLKQLASDQAFSRLQTLVDEALQSSFLERVSAIRDEIKITLQKTQEQRFLDGYFREKLQLSLSGLPESSNLREKVNDLLATSLISRNAFDAIFPNLELEISNQIQREKREIIERQLRKSLSELDYVVLEPSQEETLINRLDKGEVCLLETKYDDYHLLLRLTQEGGLVLRLIKTVADEDEKLGLSEFQQQKDRELMGEWCKNLDILKDHLMDSGIVLIEDIRIEDKIDYLTIEQLEQQKIDTSNVRAKKGSKSVIPKEIQRRMKN